MMTDECGRPIKKPPTLVIPDYKQFSIRGIKQLEEIEQALCKVGLHDPWLRNEAWRYNPAFGTARSRGMKLLFRGAPLGAALALAHFALHLALQGDHEHHHEDPCATKDE